LKNSGKIKILHTSDIHIREYRDDSWEAFEFLIKIASKEKVDFFVISGDFFDEKSSFVKLYPEIRPILNKTNFEFVIIPGNHDEKAFGSEAFLGEKVKIIRNLTEPLEYESLRIFGFPFKSITSGEIRNNLRKIKDFTIENKTNILLFHGELLDHSFSGSDFGDEEVGYMGVRLSFFDNLNLKYVLAGHFHTNFQAYELDSGGFFVYPGSPISITRKETGKRSVNLFELGKPPSQHKIDTPYYARINISVYPEENISPVSKIKKKIKKIPKEARILLSLNGYTEKQEEEFHKKIKELEDKNKNLEIENRVRGIKQLAEDELFKAFNEKLEILKIPRQPEIKRLLIKSILESEE
jgi:DNA repair exonuclease SbcCD nuclease subunit